ncbi:hypothetical protein ACJMK2_043783 [Sinanodonta woodiana]|uniref:Knr4/Smi1-like domain-containing protein n=1 Tax=Sinanodonta woodiana TaxID=1069815 RepID=A0ABD3VY04_SINWO
MDDASRTRSLIEQLNIGIIKYLEKKTGVTKIEMDPGKPADRHAVLSWEQKNMCLLPEDLKQFYLTTDGLQLTWCSNIENGAIPVGRIYINSVSSLLRIGDSSTTSYVNPSLHDLDPDSDGEEERSGLERPTFDSRCKLFELDPCDGYGKVCLVYRDNKGGSSDPKIEIWFLDRGLRWHYLTDSFTSYYRMMIMHLGLPQWQYAFTDIGLSQQAKQWFNLYALVRLELDTEIPVDVSGQLESSSSTSQLDVGRVFKGKSDKKKPVPSQTQSQQSQSIKRKPTVSSAKNAQQTGIKSSVSASQITNKLAK